MSLRPINKIRRELVKARQLLELCQSPMATPAERKKLANQTELVKSLTRQLVIERVAEEPSLDHHFQRTKKRQ